MQSGPGDVFEGMRARRETTLSRVQRKLGGYGNGGERTEY